MGHLHNPVFFFYKNSKNPHFSMCRTFSPYKMKGNTFYLNNSGYKVVFLYLCISNKKGLQHTWGLPLIINY